MRKMSGKKKEIRISYRVVAETTNQFLDGKLGFFSRRGSRLIYMAVTMQGEYEAYVGLPKGGPTKMNIIALIGREIARKKRIERIEPRVDKEVYNEIKGEIRGKVSAYMENNAKAKKKVEQIIKQRKFKSAEWLGKRPKVGKALGSLGKWIRIKRNL